MCLLETYNPPCAVVTLEVPVVPDEHQCSTYLLPMRTWIAIWSKNQIIAFRWRDWTNRPGIVPCYFHPASFSYFDTFTTSQLLSRHQCTALFRAPSESTFDLNPSLVFGLLALCVCVKQAFSTCCLLTLHGQSMLNIKT